MRALLAEIADDPAGDLGVAALAARMHMSERSFARNFLKETGRSPAQFVLAARVERAKALLERADWPLERIAERSGFGSIDALQRAFAKQVGVSRAIIAPASDCDTARRKRNRPSPVPACVRGRLPGGDPAIARHRRHRRRASVTLPLLPATKRADTPCSGASLGIFTPLPKSDRAGKFDFIPFTHRTGKRWPLDTASRAADESQERQVPWPGRR